MLCACRFPLHSEQSENADPWVAELEELRFRYSPDCSARVARWADEGNQLKAKVSEFSIRIFSSSSVIGGSAKPA
jgi:hypothetical protein